MKTALLIIDPQKDFIDDPQFMGSLAVPGAYDDMRRLAQHIENSVPEAIVVTLDSHAKMHIANAMWWVNEKGEEPGPFTLISVEDIESGKWKASNPEKQESSLNYVKELAKKDKYKLCVWPYHCIEGTEGHKVSDVLVPALEAWENVTGKKVEYIYKGRNPNTEHYSGLKAEVVIDGDPETELNQEAINYLSTFDRIEVTGEAKSHCVASTTTDLYQSLGKDSGKIVIIENCMSSVPGFESNGDAFVSAAQLAGCKVENVAQIAAKKQKLM